MNGFLEGLKFLISHGMAGYLIIIAGLACLVISLERLYFLYFSASFNSGAAIASIKKLIMDRNYSQALQVCGQQLNNPEFMVIREGLMAVESGREAFRTAVSGAVLEVSKACDRRLPYLSLIASSATLLGLFGTIMGLITTFRAISDADPAEKARLLGLGISEAMYSTASGVIVGVTAMVVYTICTSKADGIVGKAQKAALDLGTWIEKAERTGAA